MRTRLRWVLGLAVLAALTMIGCAKAKNALGSGLAWVATQGDQKLTTYSINLSTGGLSRVGSSVATGVTPAAMAITPDQKTLFLANSGDDTVSVYSVNPSDGSLTASSCSSPNCSTGEIPVALAVDPTGQFLFVANQGTFADNTSGSVSVFKISSGSITQVNSFPTETASDTTGTGPSGIAVSPASYACPTVSGQNCYAIYVANQFTNTVTAYEYFIDSSSNFNLVQTIGGSPYPAGTNPTGLAFSRCAGVSQATTHCSSADGNNLFVANAGSNNVTTFTVCIQAAGPCPAANGSLVAVSGSPVAAGVGPIFVIVDPVADFVYTVDQKSNQVSQFSYSPVTSVLSTLSPAVVSTALTPAGGAISSDGSVVIVANNGSSNVSVFKVNSGSSTGSNSAAGRLVPASPATVSLSGQPSAILLR